ncbi:MAG TPA: FKBP-type peptidyl-prolyl cis-trans isomerase [Draconibacterium sp.]|nr:FKBP-type peptidyl-prolyl cis-trans isomerase [Draconibacterium sp.]
MKKILGILAGAMVVTAMISSCNLGPDIKKEPNTPEKEQQLLDEYLNKLITEGHDIDTTDLGVYYVLIEAGDSIVEYPQTGDTLDVGYSGYLIDGSLFDYSDLYSNDGKYKFVLGDNQLIEGWNDGMKKISKGSTVQLIIPSEFAYGSAGTSGGQIPPYSTVIFVVKMFDIRPPATN